MDPEEFLKRAANPNFIAGIYNYCDRWCERCEFTNRCLNHEVSSEHEKNLEGLDASNKEFWEEMSKIFSFTMDLIQYVSKMKGIDLSAPDDEAVEQVMKNWKETDDQAENHPISIDAKKYNEMVDEFFENNKELFVQKENEWNTQIRLGLNEEKSIRESNEIKDIFEIISWYNPQIYVKMMRALTGKFEGEDFEDENGFQRDSDGSAKVALIGIDRSIGAWGKMHEMFPEKTDDIISILLHLDTLRKQIEKYFPQARNFKRVGFDD